MMISETQFESSIVKTFAGSSFDYPRKPQDRTVFLGALSIFLMEQQSYSEAELNEAIVSWLSSFGVTTTLDHVTLRRYLVDAGYLQRDDAGRRYSVDAPALAREFDESVLALDARTVVRQAQADRAARKIAHGSK